MKPSAKSVILTALIAGVFIAATTAIQGRNEDADAPQATAVELSDGKSAIVYDIGTNWRLDSVGLRVCLQSDCRYLYLTPTGGDYLEASGGSYSTVRFLADAAEASALPWDKMLRADAADTAVVAGRMRAAAQDKTMATQCVRAATRQLTAMVGLKEWENLKWDTRLEIVQVAAAAWGCGS